MFFIIHCDIICFEVSHFYNKENLSQKKETRDQIPCRRASARSRWTRAWPVVWPVVWVGMFGTRQPIIIPIKLVFFIALLPSFVDADYYDNILILRPGSPKWWIEARGRRTKKPERLHFIKYNFRERAARRGGGNCNGTVGRWVGQVSRCLPHVDPRYAGETLDFILFATCFHCHHLSCLSSWLNSDETMRILPGQS